MSTEFQKIREIAKASLMPDFFAVRIEEEALWNKLQELISKIQTPSPIASIERIKQVARASSGPIAFIDSLKEEDLWATLKDLIARIQVK